MPRDDQVIHLNENVKLLNLLKDTNIYAVVAKI
jgi:hypothetical protein